MSPLSEEIAYLKRLIKDFPADVIPEEAPKAFQKIAARYQQLEQSYSELTIANQEKRGIQNDYPSIFKERAYVFHRYLFIGIVSNAGMVRKASDPKGGRIGFGGIKHQQQRAEFKGASPSKIDNELDKAFSHLVENPEDPVEQALRFYQQFVYIHPFYDANGRIGRVIVSIYLHIFDYYVRWGEFDGPDNTEFINKLNKCHKRMKSGYTFEKYFNYLLNFFKRYIISIDELSDFK